MEQLKACSGNSCSEESGYSWYWTTPEGYKWPANTQLLGFWASGSPNDPSFTLNYANYWGYSGRNGLIDIDTSFIGMGVMCEYRKYSARYLFPT